MKLKKYISLSLAGLMMASCSDSFLEEKMVATITQDYFNTEKGFTELVTATYDALRQASQYQQGPWTYYLGLDNMTAATVTYANYSASAWNSTANVANHMDGLAAEYARNMLGYYPTINNCNRVIQTIDEGKALGKYTGEAEASRAKAEALFNRAYCVFVLNTFYGDIYFPRTYTAAMPSNFAFTRESSERTYAQLIGDLRYAFDKLPTAGNMPAAEFGRATKGAAAHFLAKLYLYRHMGQGYGNSTYGRKENGTIDNTNDKSYLGMLYKGTGTADLDSCIYYSNYVLDQDGSYRLNDDYGLIFKHEKGDFSGENSPEIVLSCVYGYPTGDGGNGRYANRMQYFVSTAYMVAQWGIPNEVFQYGYRGRSHVAHPNDFSFNVFADKTVDSRFEKSFRIEAETALPAGDYYAYNDSKNGTYTWTAEQAAFFNEHILPTYDRPSWGGRQAVAGEHKMGSGDLAFAYLENTKETAIDSLEVEAQPFYLFATWVKKGDKYYYRPTRGTQDSNHYLNTKAHGGLTTMAKELQPSTRKYDDPDRETANSYNSGRDVPLFRVSETYLMRANAYGLKGDYARALADINKVRERAAYKPGEKRAEVIARLYPGRENLTTAERQYPYEVATDCSSKMTITAAAWDGASAASKAEMYPEQNILGGSLSEADRFQNYILNEVAREFNMEEMVYYNWLHHSGWQYMRILYHDKTASTLPQGPEYWPVADNEVSDGALVDRKGLGFLQPYHTLKPFKQATIDLYTDENNVLLDEAGKKAYQNYGY